MAKSRNSRYVQFYTQGTAAYKLAPASLKKPKAAYKTVRKKRLVLYVDPLALTGIAVAVVMLVLMLVGVLQLRTAQAETVKMEKYAQQLEKENHELQLAYASGYDLEEVKWMAEALGMVPVEEVTHITVEAPESIPEELPSAWDRFCTKLAALFA